MGARRAASSLDGLEVRRPSLEDVYLELTEVDRGMALGSLHQFRYDQKVFWRNPAAVFFTVMFPLLFLFVFATFFGNHRSTSSAGSRSRPTTCRRSSPWRSSPRRWSASPSAHEARETGLLKRVRGTPLPACVFIAGRVGNSLVISVIMVVLIGGIGHFVYDVEIPDGPLPALLLAVAVGAAAFSCLGFALAAFIPNEDAAPAITNAIVFPLYFLSGIFVPENEIPDGVLNVADAFPVRALFEAIFKAYDPGTSGSGIAFGDLAVVAARA